jgi:hypothetical protein
MQGPHALLSEFPSVEDGYHAYTAERCFMPGASIGRIASKDTLQTPHFSDERPLLSRTASQRERVNLLPVGKRGPAMIKDASTNGRPGRPRDSSSVSLDNQAS